MAAKSIRISALGAIAAALVLTGCEASPTGPQLRQPVAAGEFSRYTLGYPPDESGEPEFSRYTLAYPTNVRAKATQPEFSRYTLAYPTNVRAKATQPNFSRYLLAYPND